MNKRGYNSLLQVIILIVGIFAFAYLIGSEFVLVSGACTKDDPCKADSLFGKNQQYYVDNINFYLEGGEWKAIQNGKSLPLDKTDQLLLNGATTSKTPNVGTSITTPQQPVTTPDLSSFGSGISEGESTGHWLKNIFGKSETSSPTPVSQNPKELKWSGLGGQEYNVGGNVGTLKAYKYNDNLYYVNKDGGVYADSGGNLAAVNSGLAKDIRQEIGMQDTWWSQKYTDYSPLNSLAHAGTITALTHLISGLSGMTSQQSQALDAAVFSGTIVGEGVAAKFGQGWGWTAGLIVAGAVLYSQYTKEKTITHTFTCGTWHPPAGGQYCEECNGNSLLPCSEYQCKSLGEACELVNAGTGDDKCVWKDPKDVTAPLITSWTDALMSGYTYSKDNAVSPPDAGVIIRDTENTKSAEGCIPAFTPFTFGIILDEPAKCRVDYQRKQTYDNMSYDFGGSSLFKYNHTQTMSLPGPDALASENITLQNGGWFTIYVKCQDANGNYNVNDFGFRFCVDESPDTTPPVIEVVSPIDESPIAYNTTKTNVDIYLNEAANCKWSHSAQGYDEMQNTMTCANRPTQMNAQMLYKCSATLDGLKNAPEKNKFYFQCEDVSEQKNPNQIYSYTLLGTKPLYIDSVYPDNDTVVKDASETVKVTLRVETSAGYNDGEATCSYAPAGSSNFVSFLNTDDYKHTHDLWLPQGTYNYKIKCVDNGGNADITTINFDVDSDTESPAITRIFHYANTLYVITDEEGECAYSFADCKYEMADGTPLTKDSDGIEHRTNWEIDKTYYVKCKDMYGNEPSPDECSAILRPFSYDKTD